MNVTNETKENIRDLLNDWMVDKDLSQRNAGKRLNISAATISQIINGNWEKISDVMWRSLSACLRSNPWPTRQTANFNRCIATMQDAQDNHRLSVIHGFAGAGKTTAMEQFSRKEPYAYYVLCSTTMSQKDFLKAMLRQMGALETGLTHDLLERLCSELKKCPNPVLLLDDVPKLRTNVFIVIQSIWDKIMNYGGIVISGTDYLLKQMEAAIRKQKLGAEEMLGRMEVWQDMERPSYTMVRIMCEDSGINDPDAIRFVHKHRKDYRAIRNTILNALRAKQLHDADINDPAILESLDRRPPIGLSA